METRCNACIEGKTALLLDVGQQPVCHRFQANLQEDKRHSLQLGQCDVCSTIQLINPIPIDDIIPCYPWLKSNEPEEHLDETVDTLISLFGINNNDRIIGASYKDDSMLARFKNKGCEYTYAVSQTDDLRISGANVGLESVQYYFNRDNLKKVTEKIGLAKLFIARHILEHTYNLSEFVATAKSLIEDDGLILFEIPDSQTFLEQLDYTMIWEEHTLYFTEQTFKNVLLKHGLEIAFFKKITYKHENVFYVFAKKSRQRFDQNMNLEQLDFQYNLARRYANEYQQRKQQIQNVIEKLTKNGPIAIYGAGHMSAMFINLMEIEHYIEFIVDDNPNFKLLLMPGSNLPIYASDRLQTQKIKTVIFCVSEMAQQKIMANNLLFKDSAVSAISIFPGSDLFFHKFEAMYE